MESSTDSAKAFFFSNFWWPSSVETPLSLVFLFMLALISIQQAV